MSQIGNVITEVLNSKRFNIKLKRELFLIYRKQCAINGSDIDKLKDALDQMAGDIEYAFKDSSTSTRSALQTLDAFVIGHTASHQYYQMLQLLKLSVLLYLECGTNHTDLCNSSQIVSLDLTVVLRLKTMKLLELMSQMEKSLDPRKMKETLSEIDLQ